MGHRVEWARSYKESSGQWYYCSDEARIARCACGWAIEFSWDKDADVPVLPRDSFPFLRLSHEKEIQHAIDVGVIGNELRDVFHQYAGGHSFTWPPDSPLSITGLAIEQGE